MRSLVMFFLAVLASVSLFTQGQTADTDQALMIAFAQKAAVRAVDCRQGDAESLTDAQSDFTPDGWKDFMKHMEGWLDAKGAPTFTATFSPSRNAVLVDQKDGIAQLRIPGTLKQTQNHSSTTYKAALEVYVSGTPMKIQRLEQIMCVGTSTKCQ